MSSKKITTSIKPGSDLVIGEEFILDIFLTSDTPISSDASVELTPYGGIGLRRHVPPIVLSDNNRKGTISVELRVDNNIVENNEITLDIQPNSAAIGFEKISVFYYAKTLDFSSVQLAIGADYLDMPTEVNDPPGGRYFVKVGTVKTAITNKDNTVKLSGTPVNILDTPDRNFDKVDFYQDDKKTKIPIRKIGSKRGFIINTDPHGKLNFYIYAKQESSVVLNLYSQIFGATGEISADKTLYILDSDQTDVNSMDSLSAPVIAKVNNGVLHNDGSSLDFSVNIPPYDNASGGDTIFFFINGKMIDNPHRLLDPDYLGTPFIRLPYSVFNENKEKVNFYYSVIKESADRLVSDSLEFTYTKYIPPADNVYEKCLVYSSLGVGKDNLITESDIINYKTISHYKDNANHEALFVKVIGTNDLNDKTKIPLGSEVTLNLHIHSKLKKVDKSFGQKRMPTTAGDDGVTNYVIFGIPQIYLEGNDEFDIYNQGKIYFSYTVNIDNTKVISQIWKGQINIAPPDEIIPIVTGYQPIGDEYEILTIQINDKQTSEQIKNTPISYKIDSAVNMSNVSEIASNPDTIQSMTTNEYGQFKINLQGQKGGYGTITVTANNLVGSIKHTMGQY
ncbi:hypothetical protein [Xenorhabdus griffiniae]|uniref:Inverse autotransporter beta-barrel domain-containing protein n=1 Tax=Xenorhabdus griffiniae TaxID=351672 RepID=A0ABY9XCV9_9GAMM|nr:hypothetical protein [Xenorhabdus griffiniae]MBD1226466.1 hypothetical protein [Xenorhabdus griffiniae]MBE8587131.1 hypothetical protein [Xenorhabdus griffiniae]WMV70692.1 hypothetical protein QL128_10615 [Xenorhabdus griffiniae]WNH00369.1 hypothetical protein QL112_010620 [Xenorhabdus griffiniae]